MLVGRLLGNSGPGGYAFGCGKFLSLERFRAGWRGPGRITMRLISGKQAADLIGI